MKQISIILTILLLSNLVYSQEKIGFYFIDQNYKDTIFIFENDSLYDYVIYVIDEPGYQYCNGDGCNGFIEEYYLNGKLKHSGFYENGQILNGQNLDFYKNGKPEQVGQLKTGRRIGQWIWYTKDGFVEAIYQYDSLGRTVMELSFHENGKIMDYQLVENDSSCLKLMNTYYETGELNTHYFQPECDNGNEIRILKEYYKNGQLKLNGQYLNRKKNGLFEYYDNKGVLIKTEKYRNGELINTTATNG